MKPVFLLLSIILFPCYSIAQTGFESVDPFIGTREMGHTFPGATVPFGFVQLSPDTDTVPYEVNGQYNPSVYRYCAGYQYDDPTIVGFSHTHFSGTGHSDLGDILVMPTVGPVKLNPGTAKNPESGYRSRFRHETEKAMPGYYSVYLENPDVLAEMTVTGRCGFHQYTFPETDSANIILDLVHGIYNYEGKVVWASLKKINDTMVEGYRITNGWARTRHIYFVMIFSKPFLEFGFKNEEKQVYRGFWRRFNQEAGFPEMAGRKIKGWFRFRTEPGEKITIRVGLSGVSTEGALKNLLHEIPDDNFELTRSQAEQKWKNELSRIRLVASDEQRITFYTALYHALLAPVVYQDVDGFYRGIDHKIHKAEGFINYTIFSLWDTYRALHPWLTLFYPDLTGDLINSMLAHQQQSPEKMLPVWSHHGNENWCMIGYHAIPVIADAYTKGVRGFDPKTALTACLETAGNPYYEGTGEYRQLGYVPVERSANSASVTLEYAFDDFTLFRLSEAISKDPNVEKQVRISAQSEVHRFSERSQYFKNIWDSVTGFMRARHSDGLWETPFDPLSTHGQGFIEGNSWNYSFHVPQNVPALIGLMGGEKRFSERLDSLFSMHLDDVHFRETEDVTRVGLIGNYVHGNEPSHHIPYLYNWTSQAWKTQEKVRLIMRTMYRNSPDGLCGNDDCGQMSAWYLFSALGFYPVCPGDGRYYFGLPLAPEAHVKLPGGKTLTILAKGLSREQQFVQKIRFNGREINDSYIDHQLIVQGGMLEFEMGSEHP